MRRAIGVIVCLSMLSGLAAGEDPPPKPLTSEQAADAVLAAVQANDDVALKAHAEKDDPDPWLVADELIRRTEFEAADAFAKAAPRVDVEKLPAYVESSRGTPDDAANRARLAAAQAASDAGGVLEALGEALGGPPTTVSGIRVGTRRGEALQALGRLDEAAAALLLAAEGAERIGWLGRASTALGLAGMAAARAARFEGALANWTRKLALDEGRGAKAEAADTLRNIGITRLRLGDPAEAEAAFVRAVKLQESSGDGPGLARALADLATLYSRLGDPAKALPVYERARAAAEAVGDRAGAIDRQESIAVAHAQLGDYTQALLAFDRVLVAREAAKDRAGAAATLGNIAGLHNLLGQYDRALAAHARALGAQEELGDKPGIARTLGNMGTIYDLLNDYERAIETHERALAMKEAVGDEDGVAATLQNLGAALAAVGRHEQARGIFERALAMMEARGNQDGIATCLVNLGALQTALGEHAKALAIYERVLASTQERRDKAGSADALLRVADARFELSDWKGALEAARSGAALVPYLVTGLADEQGATARAQHIRLFGIGARAAARIGDPAHLSAFLEQSRAGSLLEALEARELLQAGVVPPALAAPAKRARAREAVASAAYREALARGDLKASRAARRELESAQTELEAAVERIQREAKAAANVVHFKPDLLDSIRARLAPDQALVLYGLFTEECVALVVTPGAAVPVRLGAAADIDVTAMELIHAARSGQDLAALQRAAEALRHLVIVPLELPPATRRLLISPDGALSYVPFALLAPDREVAYVMSGTTYGLLLEDHELSGTEVLALGDPDYQASAEKLTRLPATAVEAKEIGSRVLLGTEASEGKLRAAVDSKARWRAIHFACHGIVDNERPAFSSLALTPADEDDGYLTVLEVFQARFPADLVALSACETAQGKEVRGEGVMGLTRAFMFAGAPRVICSLWKVDDEATRALMVKFYELWNPKDDQPGLAAAEALRQAQNFIREHPDHPEWKHPYYWAAWVLWGLPD